MAAVELWLREGEKPNLSFVADRVGRLLTGPVSDAYNALLSEPPANTKTAHLGPNNIC
jgi:hypothetical protein